MLPRLVGDYAGRALAGGGGDITAVRVHQTGELFRAPAARAMRFDAVEDFDVERVAFTWRARFPFGLRVVDSYADGVGRLRVSLLGIPLQTQTGAETDVGEAMRYLAELPWAPHALTANPELRWSSVGGHTVEVACGVGNATAAVRWEFDAAGDPVRATGSRPYKLDGTFQPVSWGGDFSGFTDFAGTRAPTRGEAWWELPKGRFVYWRGRVTSLELLGA